MTCGRMDLRHGHLEFCAVINSQADWYATLSTFMCHMHVGAQSHCTTLKLLTSIATENC